MERNPAACSPRTQWPTATFIQTMPEVPADAASRRDGHRKATVLEVMFGGLSGGHQQTRLGNWL